MLAAAPGATDTGSLNDTTLQKVRVGGRLPAQGEDGPANHGVKLFKHLLSACPAMRPASKLVLFMINVKGFKQRPFSRQLYADNLTHQEFRQAAFVQYYFYYGVS